MSNFPTTILVGSDGSPESRDAIEYAGELARATNSKLHLVHIGLLSNYTNPDQMNSRQYDRLKTEARSRLDNEIEWAAEKDISINKTHLRMGRVDGELIRLAQEMDAGLIVVGNRGMGAIARILLGSDAESIVRHAPCPVIVVRTD